MAELTLSERISHAPDSCGVYQWFEHAGDRTPLYVGKARNLRSRLRQYLNSDDLKTTFLMRRASHIEWIATDNETEALLLENNLIKKHRPVYNVRLKDDKQYPYICISMSEPFPRIYLTRRRLPGNLYFGPFSKAQVAREKIQLTLDMFPLRRRPLKLPLAKPAKPCLNYHLKKCLAPCAEKISQHDYAAIVQQAIDFISGSDDEIRQQVEKKMHRLAAEMKFEEAARLRDILAYFNERNITPQVEMRDALPDFDIVGIYSAPLEQLKADLSLRDEDLSARKSAPGADLRMAQICLLKFRDGRLIAKENFSVTETDMNSATLSDAEFAETFFRDYYLGMIDLPPYIVVPDGLDLASWSEALKTGLRVLGLAEFSQAVKDANKEVNPAALMQMANNNARLVMRERLLSENLRNQRVGLKQLQKFIGLKNPPQVIECYDISNIQGTDPVASGVMLRDGMPYKSGYRKYRIKTIEGANDPAMMHEALSRRLARVKSGEVQPADLIVIDGGSTQLNAALQARSEAGLSIPMIGLAKKQEEIYTEDGRILRFDKESPGMQIIRRARDEAHRFAVSYHRNLRMKRNLRSVFDGVEGIGEKKRAAILLALRKLDLGEIDATALAKKIRKESGVTAEQSEALAQKIFAGLKGQ
ncbi:MAG TPA: excinuclease ABC subunit UvrC [Turneriella sp.]|nr:excinuclease ABC subunit UvrC [Turneriella sp.]HNJ64733.1 excinuclease ABC subunit UvrC [Turneriella sp.]HNL10316.1 excinuclease ABC subunit UvrC [Turneriella sp.]